MESLSLVGVLVFLTVFVGAVTLLTRQPAGEVIRQRLQKIERERSPRATVLTLPFHQRTFFPLVKSAVERVARLMPPKSIAVVQSNLAKAGRRNYDPLLWIFLKWLGAALLGIMAYGIGVLARWPSTSQILFAVSTAGLGYLWPELRIRRTIESRQTRIIKELPETLDLLTISVEAGLGLDQALEVVTSRRPGPLSEEIRTYLDEVRLGRNRHEALKAIGSRTGVEDLISFAATLVQAMEYGVSIALVLRIQADEVRTRRRQRIEERAMKVPVKLLFPIVFLILPAVFVVAAGPGLIRAYTEFIRPSGVTTFGPPPPGH